MRRVRLITPALLIMCCLLVTTGCGSGQVAQTSTQVITQEGANAERGGVALRGVVIPTPPHGAYESGGVAPLHLAIATEETASDTLYAVTTDAATSVVLVESPLPTASAALAPSGSASPAASGSASPSAAPESVNLEIGPGRFVLLPQPASHLELRGLLRELTPGTTVTVTFSFSKAGDITLDVPVATPDSPGPRPKPSEAGHE